MADTCNYRGFSWLVKSCIPDSCLQVAESLASNPRRPNHDLLPAESSAADATPILALPDDLLAECLYRLPLSSLPSLSLVCHRFALLIESSAFLDLRRSRGRLRHTLMALHVSDPGLVTAAALPIHLDPSWDLFASPKSSPSSLPVPDGAFSQTRLAAVGRAIYIIGRGATLRYDFLTGVVALRAPTLFPRKKFAAAVVGGRIYVAGGVARTSVVEEYDPEADEWKVVAEAPRRRYGCMGAAAGGVFYVIGGLRVGSRGEEVRGAAHACAGSMDAYHVRTGTWLRVRSAVPGGGCVVGACGAGQHVYVLASHAVDLSFWKWEARGRRGGDWTRLESPPAALQLRLGGAVRFSCAGIGDNKVVVVVHCDPTRSGGLEYSALLFFYNIAAGEWSRGPDLPPGLRRAACASVEC